MPPKYNLPINTSAKDGSKYLAGVKTAVHSQQHGLLAPQGLHPHPASLFPTSSFTPLCLPFGILCGSSHTELTACSSPKIGRAVSFCLFKCCSICLKYLVFSQAAKDSLPSHPTQTPGSRTFSLERERTWRGLCQKTELPSEQMMETGLVITWPEITDGIPDLESEVVLEAADKTRPPF